MLSVSLLGAGGRGAASHVLLMNLSCNHVPTPTMMFLLFRDDVVPGSIVLEPHAPRKCSCRYRVLSAQSGVGKSQPRDEATPSPQLPNHALS